MKTNQWKCILLLYLRNVVEQTEAYFDIGLLFNSNKTIFITKQGRSLQTFHIYIQLYAGKSQTRLEQPGH